MCIITAHAHAPISLCRRASRTNITQDSSVFICISMLARAVGPQVEKDIKALLDQMFSVGLSVDLTSALRVIAQEVPQLQRDIQGQFICIKNYVHVCTK